MGSGNVGKCICALGTSNTYLFSGKLGAFKEEQFRGSCQTVLAWWQVCHPRDSNRYPRSTESRVQAGRKPPADEETPQKVKALRASSRASVARG